MEHNLQDRQTGLWARLRERAAAWNDPEARQQRGRLAGQRRRLARDYRVYGGEDTHAHYDRVAEFMKDLESAPEDARIAAVCHEGTIMAMLCYVLHTDIPRNIIHVANCAVCAFKFGNGVWELGEWNETGSVTL